MMTTPVLSFPAVSAAPGQVRLRAQRDPGSLVAALLGVMLLAGAFGDTEYAARFAIAGLPLILFGTLKQVRRSEFVIDLAAGRLRARMGVTGRWTDEPLALDAVVLSKEKRSRGNQRGSYTLYVVSLPLRQDGPPVRVLQAREDQVAARRELERLARLLGIDAVDRSGPTETRRPPDALDDSVGERLADLGVVLSPGRRLPPPPADGRITCREDPDGLRVQFPDTAFETLGLKLLAAATAIVGIGVFSLSGAGRAGVLGLPGPVAALVFGIVLVVALAIVAGLVSHLEIVESADALRFVRRLGPLRLGQSVIAKAAIEEIAPVAAGTRSGQSLVPEPPKRLGLLVRSDDHIERLGTRLDDPDLAWLERALVALAATTA